jgi:hypothetical protein
MELRWLVTKNKVTASQILKYAQDKGVSMSEAKSTLVNRTKPKLQCREGMGYDWRDVPLVIEEFTIKEKK